MTELQYGETPTQLIELAQANNYTVSATQLGRWHRAGLLPTPSPPLGDEQESGKQWVYPPGTGEQLLALCKLRKQHGPGIPLLRLAWLLWWQGYDIPPARIRTFLTSTIAKLQEVLEKLAAYFQPTSDAEGEEGGLPDVAFDLLEQMETGRTRLKAARQMRKRVGTSNFPTLIRMFFEVALGAFQIERYSNEDDREIVTKAFGLKYATWFDTDMLSSLQELSQRFHDRSLQDMLTEATDADLLQGRDELRTFLTALEQISVYTGHDKGRRGQGLTVIGDLVSLMKASHLVLLLVTWASLRRHASPHLQQNMDTVLQAARQFPTLASGQAVDANVEEHQTPGAQ